MSASPHTHIYFTLTNCKNAEKYREKYEHLAAHHPVWSNRNTWPSLLHFFLFTYFLETKYRYNKPPGHECLSLEYNSVEYNMNYAPWNCSAAVQNLQLHIYHAYVGFSTLNTCDYIHKQYSFIGFKPCSWYHPYLTLCNLLFKHHHSY